MMPFGFKEGKTNTDTGKNTQINPTTKSMNAEEEKTKLLTSLHKKTEEKNKEKEDERFVDKIKNKTIEFINMKEPGWMSYHLPDEHTDKMLNIGAGMALFGMWLGVGALFAGMAGSPIIAGGLVVTGFLSIVVGFSIATIGTLRG